MKKWAMNLQSLEKQSSKINTYGTILINLHSTCTGSSYENRSRKPPAEVNLFLIFGLQINLSSHNTFVEKECCYFSTNSCCKRLWAKCWTSVSYWLEMKAYAVRYHKTLLASKVPYDSSFVFGLRFYQVKTNLTISKHLFHIFHFVLSFWTIKTSILRQKCFPMRGGGCWPLPWNRQRVPTPKEIYSGSRRLE